MKLLHSMHLKFLYFKFKEVKVITPRMAHPKYRADIDGLRALAILSVVIYHAFPNILPGGFIGVDIFFVISGFLISGIIFNSLESHTFSFTEFYSRRIRRIFPALLIVLLTSLILGWLYLLADEYALLGKHVASAAGFVTNIILLDESGYFNTAAQTKPLLHLWSLGVEEQFYLLFPLITWYAFKKKINIPLVIGGLALVSFYLGISQANRDAAFYLPQFRFWEMMAGSMLAYTIRRKGHVHRAFGTIGLALITASFLFITEQSLFPGWWTLLPVIGTVAVIAAGSRSAVNYHILSNRTLVWFGLISYPLYLWHWVLLSFCRIMEVGPPPLWMRLTVVALSIALAWLTWRFGERALRFGGGPARTIGLIVAMVLVGGVGYLTYQLDGYVWRSKQSEYLIYAPQFGKWNFKQNQNCTNNFTEKQLDFLVFCVANSKNPEIALFGDSHANQLYPGLLHAYGDNKGIISIGNGPPLDGIKVRFDKPTDHPWVNGYKSYDLVMQRILNDPSIKTVVYAANWEGPIHGRFILEEHRLRVGDVHLIKDGIEGDNKTYFKLGFDKTLKKLIDANKNIIVVIDTPEIMVNPRKCLRDLNSKAMCSFSKDLIMKRQEYSRAFFADMKEKYPKIKILDPVDIICPTETCYLHQDGYLTFRDLSHISEHTSDKIGSKLMALIDSF